MLLIDDDQAEPGERQEGGGSGADQDIDRSGAAPLPKAQPFAVGYLAVQAGRVWEALLEARLGLGR